LTFFLCEWGFGLPVFLSLLIPCVRACLPTHLCVAKAFFSGDGGQQTLVLG
jgi:hypothetical protein